MYMARCADVNQWLDFPFHLSMTDHFLFSLRPFAWLLEEVSLRPEDLLVMNLVVVVVADETLAKAKQLEMLNSKTKREELDNRVALKKEKEHHTLR